MIKKTLWIQKHRPCRKWNQFFRSIKGRIILREVFLRPVRHNTRSGNISMNRSPRALHPGPITTRKRAKPVSRESCCCFCLSAQHLAINLFTTNDATTPDSRRPSLLGIILITISDSSTYIYRAKIPKARRARFNIATFLSLWNYLNAGGNG